MSREAEKEERREASESACSDVEKLEEGEVLQRSESSAEQHDGGDVDVQEWDIVSNPSTQHIDVDDTSDWEQVSSM